MDEKKQPKGKLMKKGMMGESSGEIAAMEKMMVGWKSIQKNVRKKAS